jgi:diguanylate cyclase (GGDEF)-like protein
MLSRFGGLLDQGAAPTRRWPALVPVAWVLAAACALVVMAAVIQHLAGRHLAADAERVAVGWGQHMARVVPDLDLVFLGERPGPEAQDHLLSLRDIAGLVRYRMFDPDGQLVLLSESMGTPPRADDAEPAAVEQARRVVRNRHAETELLRGDGVALPAVYSRAWVPAMLGAQVAGVIEVVVDQTDRARTTEAFFQRAAGVAGGAMLLCMLAAAGLLRHRAGQDQRAQERIDSLAKHDALTGALNHSQFSNRLALACLGQARPQLLTRSGSRSRSGLAVICIDLDNFGEVNENHGHGVGDRLLRRTAQRLQGVLRAGDLLARIAGDRFAVLQQGAVDGASVTALVERIITCLAEPHELAGTGADLRISACVGATLFGIDGRDADSLLHNAETALLRAKSGGRGAWCFYDASLDRTLQERRSLAKDLGESLHKGWLRLHFQPVFTGDGQTLKGYEALARWPHPTRGMVPPAVFIPVAEDSGHIVELGRWVLASACAEAQRWPGPLSVAVNLSTAQFAQGLDVVQDVRDALHKSGLPGHRLELEITESLLMNHTDEVLAILHALRALGVRIAMDDFGTGYSSLAYLWRFPFDKLKIDRAFTQGLGVDQRVNVIVRSIVRLAHSLSIRVNAEGVETEEQRDALHQMGCDELQGYLLGRPAPAERLLHVEQEVVAIVVPDVELA